MAELQIELVRMQYWVKQQGLKVVLIFEGRDAAGKGGTIKRLTEPLNPRGASVVALPAPSDRERTQWYFQRYVAHLPAAGEIVILDRSWYNRGGVERVMGFCTEEEYRDWLRSTPEFERMLVRSGIVLLKYWFSVSDAEQEARFQARAVDPLKRWKLSPMDFESREKWVEFSKAKDEMFSYTDIREAPWYTIEADDKKTARLNCISHVLERIPYEDALPGPIKLPERPRNTENYQRPPKTSTLLLTAGSGSTRRSAPDAPVGRRDRARSRFDALGREATNTRLPACARPTGDHQPGGLHTRRPRHARKVQSGAGHARYGPVRVCPAGSGGRHRAGIIGSVIHAVRGDETELVRAAVEWAARRVVRPTDSKTTARPASELAAAAGRTVTPAGIGGTEALRVFRDVLQPATRSQDDPMNLAYIPSAPTRAAVAFDLVTPSRHLPLPDALARDRTVSDLLTVLAP